MHGRAPVAPVDELGRDVQKRLVPWRGTRDRFRIVTGDTEETQKTAQWEGRRRRPASMRRASAFFCLAGVDKPGRRAVGQKRRTDFRGRRNRWKASAQARRRPAACRRTSRREAQSRFHTQAGSPCGHAAGGGPAPVKRKNPGITAIKRVFIAAPYGAFPRGSPAGHETRASRLVLGGALSLRPSWGRASIRLPMTGGAAGAYRAFPEREGGGACASGRWNARRPSARGGYSSSLSERRNRASSAARGSAP